jgi:hypothetical protein
VFKLMIKTHNVTGLKYLCITKREKYEEYLGSGTYWSNHLEKYGKSITTQILFQSDDYKVFVENCNYYSMLYDVVSSKEWANLVPETGYNNDDGLPNVVLFWLYADDETKQEIIHKRTESIKNNHYSKSEDADAIYQIIGAKVSSWWKNMPEDTKDKILSSLWEGQRKWRENLSDDEKKEIYERSLGQWKRNASFEELSEKNRMARLNTSPEVKERRKKKLQALHATGKYNDSWEKMSEERQGADNPAARKVEIDGVVYLCIKDVCEDLGLTRAVVSNRLKSEKYQSWKRL